MKKTANSKNIFHLLKERGFVFQTSDEKGLAQLLSGAPATIYEGIDPSADSLHLGHLVSLMAMHHLQEAGHKVVFILGGATGEVGDPTGKTKARKLLSPEEAAKNGEKIKKQVEKMGLVRFKGENAALMMDNREWFGKASFLKDFMRERARFFSVNEMVKMKTFAERLASNENLSLMELCYPVMQAWDFLELFRKYNCRVQMGGQDQWTNILQGKELIHKAEGKEAFGFTFPLLTTSDGAKMGKTEKGPVWLDAGKTSPFDLYQYLVGTSDSLLEIMLKLLTFLPLKEIEKTLKDPRQAQRILAFEVTKLVHGEKEAEKARKDSERLFNQEKGSVEGIPICKVSKQGKQLDDILVDCGLLSSKSEVRRRCEGGGVRFKDKKVSDSKFVIKEEGIIRFGKKDFLKIEIMGR